VPARFVAIWQRFAGLLGQARLTYIHAMKESDLRRKARQGTLEVEHLLQAAVCRLPGLRAVLAEIAARDDWKKAEDPFATWAAVAVAYAEGGMDGLHALARGETSHFVIGLLEELRSVEAVHALLTWWPEAITYPDGNSDLAWRIASTLNLVLSFKGAPQIEEVQHSEVRQFAYRLYDLAHTDLQRATSLLMLRGVGDAGSLAFVERADEFAPPWADTKGAVVRAIRRRVRAASRG
jgi:hypothetical protein